MQTLFCWEFKKCGREHGGARVAELGVCPVANFIKLANSVHGQSAVRACWAAKAPKPGTEDDIESSDRISNCVNCEYYRSSF